MAAPVRNILDNTSFMASNEHDDQTTCLLANMNLHMRYGGRMRFAMDVVKFWEISYYYSTFFFRIGSSIDTFAEYTCGIKSCKEGKSRPGRIWLKEKEIMTDWNYYAKRVLTSHPVSKFQRFKCWILVAKHVQGHRKKKKFWSYILHYMRTIEKKN
jgi:hypothetical protein